MAPNDFHHRPRSGHSLDTARYAGPNDEALQADRRFGPRPLTAQDYMDPQPGEHADPTFWSMQTRGRSLREDPGVFVRQRDPDRGVQGPPRAFSGRGQAIGYDYERDRDAGPYMPDQGPRSNRGSVIQGGQTDDEYPNRWAGTPAGRGHRGHGPKNYVRSDQRIREDVCDALSHWHADVSEIEVEVREGEVILTGEVASWWTKRGAEDIAIQANGVRDCRNDVRVVAHGQGERPNASE